MPNARPKKKENEKEGRKQEGMFYNWANCRKKITILFDHIFVIKFRFGHVLFKHQFLCQEFAQLEFVTPNSTNGLRVRDALSCDLEIPTFNI